MDDMEDPNEETNNGQAEEDNNSNNRESAQARNGIKNKTKDAVKNAVKEGAKRFGKAVAKGLLKIMSNPYVLLGVAIVVLIFTCIIYVQGKMSSATYTESVESYVNDSISDEKLKTIFNEKKSLIYFSLNDIDKIYDSFIDANDGEPNVVEDMQKMFENGNPGNDGIKINGGAVSVNDKRELYKHILLTEKYNFNNIKWTEYNHNGSVNDAKLVVDKDMGMQYPDDSSRTIDSFISMTMPYIQSWYIPLSMYCNSGTSVNDTIAKNAEFAYQIIAKAYSNISINKYNKQSYEKVTDRYDYVETKYNTWKKYDKDGILIDSGHNETATDGKIPEAKVSEKTETNTEYALVEAKTFDVIEKNSYEFTPYSTNDEPDFEQVVDEPYNKSTPETTKTVTNMLDGTKIVYKSHTETVGTRYVRTRVWNDKLTSTGESEKSTYTVDDIKTYIGGDFENASAGDYYTDLQNDGKIDKLDFLNADPNIYGKYINSGDEYQVNIGCTKSYLIFSYGILADSLNAIIEEEGDYPYIYGQSLEIVGSNLSSSSGGLWSSTDGLSIDPNIKLILPFDKKYKNNINMNIVSKNPIVYGYSGHAGIDTAPSHSEFKDMSKNFTTVNYSVFGRNPFLMGPDVYAPCSGTLLFVQYAEYNKYYSTGNSSNTIKWTAPGYSFSCTGGTVLIQAANGDKHFLTHLFPNKALFEQLGARVGGQITIGEKIGNMGNTGNSTGPHLHYEVAPSGGRVNVVSNGEYTGKIIKSELEVNVSYTTVNSNSTGAISLKNGITVNDLPGDIKPFHENLMKYAGYISSSSQKYGISTLWIMATIASESGFDPNCGKDSKWGQGLMQLEWNGCWENSGYTKQEILDPERNIDLGTQMLSNLYKKADNSIYEAIGRYCRGVSGWNSMKEKVGFTGIVRTYDDAVKVFSTDRYPRIIEIRQKYYDLFSKYYSIN